MGEQAKRGLWNGGSIPYGYAYDKNTQKLLPHPEEAAVVRRIYEQASSLVSLTDVANHLNVQGLRTKQRFFRRRDGTHEVVEERRFRSDGLRILITNPIYRGIVRFDGKEYKGQHEPLVSDKVWEQANAAVRPKPLRPEVRVDENVHQYLLKGICRCGHCGRAMIPQTSGLSNNAGKRYRYYNCISVMRERRLGDCPVGRLSAQALEGAVVGFLSKVSKHPDLVAGVLEATRVQGKGDRTTIRSELATAEARLGEVSGELSRCVDLVVKGTAGALGPELMKRVERLRAEQDQLLVGNWTGRKLDFQGEGFIRRLGLAVMHRDPHRPVAGIDQKIETLGATAVDTLVAQLHRHERGAAADPVVSMIEGAWVAGSTVRLRPA